MVGDDCWTINGPQGLTSSRIGNASSEKTEQCRRISAANGRSCFGERDESQMAGEPSACDLPDVMNVVPCGGGATIGRIDDVLPSIIVNRVDGKARGDRGIQRDRRDAI